MLKYWTLETYRSTKDTPHCYSTEIISAVKQSLNVIVCVCVCVND